MNPVEAKECAEMLVGLLGQGMTPEQAVFWTEEFERFDYAAAQAAIREHVRNHEFLSTPALQEGIRSETRKRVQPVGDGIKRDGVAAEWREVDEILGAFTDAELIEWRAYVVKQYPNLTELLDKANPKSNKALRALIYEAIKRGEAA